MTTFDWHGAAITRATVITSFRRKPEPMERLRVSSQAGYGFRPAPE